MTTPKKVALLKMTIREREILDEVTRNLADLNLEEKSEISSARIELEVDSSGQEKRTRTLSYKGSKYLSGATCLFDPLLYLRANHSSDPAEMSPEAANQIASAPPGLDEILSMTRNALLVEPIPLARPKEVARPLDELNNEQVSRNAPRMPVAVDRFCQKFDVSYVSIKISRTFRSITFSRSRSVDDKSDPWGQYLDLNRLRHYRLCHALYFCLIFAGEDGVFQEEERVVVIVPHISRTRGETDVEKIRTSLHASSVRRISLTQLEKELGFPTFVCPPFGHEFAPKIHKSEKKFRTVIDSSLVVPGETDCVFDLGMVAIRIPPSELNRLATTLSWTIEPNLVKLRDIS